VQDAWEGAHDANPPSQRKPAMHFRTMALESPETAGTTRNLRYGRTAMSAPHIFGPLLVFTLLFGTCRADEFITLTKERIEVSERSVAKVSILRTGGSASSLTATARVTGVDGVVQDLPVNFPAGSSSTVEVEVPTLSDDVFTGSLRYSIELIAPDGVTVAPISRATLVCLEDEWVRDEGEVFRGVYFGGPFFGGVVNFAFARTGVCTISLQPSGFKRRSTARAMFTGTGMADANVSLIIPSGLINLHLQRFESPAPYEIVGRSGGPEGPVVLIAGRVARGADLQNLPATRVFSGVMRSELSGQTLYAPTTAKLNARGHWSFRGRTLDGRAAVHRSAALTNGRVIFAHQRFRLGRGARLGILKINAATQMLEGTVETASDSPIGPFSNTYQAVETSVLGAYTVPLRGQYPSGFAATNGAGELTLRGLPGASMSQKFMWSLAPNRVVPTPPVVLPLAFTHDRTSGRANGLVRLTGVAAPLRFTAALVNAPGDPLDQSFVGVAGADADIRTVVVAPAVP